MSIYDLYIISPYVAMSLAAVLVIVVDLLSPKKALLPAAAILSLLAPLALSLIQLDALGDSPHLLANCLLYTSPSPRDGLLSRMPSSA